MREQFVRLDPDRGLIPITADAVRFDGGSESAAYWVDLTDPTPDQVGEWLERLGVALPVTTIISQLVAAPRALALGGVVFTQFPEVNDLDDPHPLYISSVLTSGCLLTAHPSGSALLTRFEEGVADSVWLVAPTPAGVLTELIELAVEVGLTQYAGTRERLQRLQTIAEETPEQIDTADVLELKRHTSRLQSVLEDQGMCAESLIEQAQDGLDGSTNGHRLAAAARSLDHLGRRAERSQARLDEIQRQASLVAQEAANRRLNALTIVQAIFVPLTLVVGVYGMNFVFMPELNWVPGYFTIMAIMALIAAGELLYFWKKGWFD